MKKFSTKIISLLLIIGLNWTGFSAIGQTFAHFNDTENSSGNVYSAGTLDFFIPPPILDFSPNVTPTTTASRNIGIDNVGSLPFEYQVTIKNVSGGLCDHLNLEAKLGGEVKYDDPITENQVFPIVPLLPILKPAKTHNWTFIATSTLIDSDVDLQGEICNFDFVFNGSQIGGAGFSDEEIVANTVKAAYWNPPVVLNEFLPNADNYPEFIELYNTTDSSINLQGYKIRTDNKVIPINPATTGRYSNGTTTISAYGWLVVAAPVATPDPPHGWGDIMGNSTGTITFYNKKNVEIDSYTYGPPEHNVNNNPGWTNNLIGYWPFDGDTQAEQMQDLSGNGNHVASDGTISIDGKINEARDFGDANDYGYVDIGSSPVFDADETTIEAWFEPKSYATGIGEDEARTIIWNGDCTGGHDPYWVLVNVDGHLEARMDYETPYQHQVITSDNALTLNTWHHFALSISAAETKLYIDSALQTEIITGAGSTCKGTNYIAIGRSMWHWNAFDGLIDEVKIYDRALDSDEIKKHYDSADSFNTDPVPVDKSYARIPDGIGEWIDPVPTPGAFNKLSPEEISVQNTSMPVAEESDETPDVPVDPETTEPPVIPDLGVTGDSGEPEITTESADEETGVTTNSEITEEPQTTTDSDTADTTLDLGTTDSGESSGETTDSGITEPPADPEAIDDTEESDTGETGDAEEAGDAADDTNAGDVDDTPDTGDTGDTDADADAGDVGETPDTGDTGETDKAGDVAVDDTDVSDVDGIPDTPNASDTDADTGSDEGALPETDVLSDMPKR